MTSEKRKKKKVAKVRENAGRRQVERGTSKKRKTSRLPAADKRMKRYLGRFFFFFSVPRELSSLRPQTPLGEILATKGGSRVSRIRCNSVHADIKMGAQDCGFLLFWGRKKTRHLLEPIATILRRSLRIFLSAVITTQRLCPHSASQVSSDSSALKWSSWTLTAKPASRNSEANCFFPKLRSRKKILISGCWGVAKNLFDLRHS